MDAPVLVAGATGGVGQQVAHRLVQSRRAVRAIVRDPIAAARVLDFQTELITADVTNAASLTPAFRGVRHVVCTIGSRAVEGGNPERIDYMGVRNLVDTACAAGVEHFVLVSTIAVTQRDHPLNRYGRVLDWKLKGEDWLRASGLTYTIVRPGGLVDDPGGRLGVTVDQGDRISGRVTRADVAEACLAAFAHRAARNVTFEMINSAAPGPADWAALFASLAPDRQG